MSRGKTGFVVLTFFAAMFLLFIAILFGSTSKRQEVIDRKQALDARLDEISGQDITIFWIGEMPSEYEHIASVTQVISPENVSFDNLPVKGHSFHIVSRDENEKVTNEVFPDDYSRYLFIVIYGDVELSDTAKEALLDCISQNAVPVIAIGDGSSEIIGNILMHRRSHTGEGSSLYYCLGSGYEENLIPKEKVIAGGMDLAEEMPAVFAKGISDYIPQS